jgi:hypothetical protein
MHGQTAKIHRMRNEIGSDLVEHGGFIDVIVGRNAIIVGAFGESANVLCVVSTDVHVEEDDANLQLRRYSLLTRVRALV